MRRVLAGLLAAAMSGGAAIAGPLDLGDYDALVGFGDSTADSGNANLLSGAAPAAGGYFQGRFSNSLNYFDQLAVEISGAPAVPNFAGGANYAFGGARIIDDPGGVPDFNDQTSAYLSGPVQANALHAVNLGGNDSFAFIFGGGTDLHAFADLVAATFTMEIQDLIDGGATDFLLSGVPNVGLTPIVIDFFGGDVDLSVAFADPVAQIVNRKLLKELSALARANPTANIFYFDAITPFDPLVADPAAFGLDPDLIAIPCQTDPAALVPDENGDTCVGYTFIDTVHLAATGQEVLFNAAREATRVPAPGGLALFALGGLALGFSALRRRA